ncbi:hypothetical protein SAMN05216189_101692 [Pseudomonas delhiensis]|uniref:Uncharacterized protein n=1 Tax=Pseudomonas delhiensis TaxID=366289 RepID=A0A239M389_9PSED|nr:hypothetical protein SAMN05216189_101692 [Pseudomonas delhiensis]SNT37156.1 hypothetical protein SAMN06295949_12392 [Pseudomonas delhiensis]
MQERALRAKSRTESAPTGCRVVRTRRAHNRSRLSAAGRNAGARAMADNAVGVIRPTGREARTRRAHDRSRLSAAGRNAGARAMADNAVGVIRPTGREARTRRAHDRSRLSAAGRNAGARAMADIREAWHSPAGADSVRDLPIPGTAIADEPYGAGQRPWPAAVWAMAVASWCRLAWCALTRLSTLFCAGVCTVVWQLSSPWPPARFRRQVASSSA